MVAGFCCAMLRSTVQYSTGIFIYLFILFYNSLAVARHLHTDSPVPVSLVYWARRTIDSRIVRKTWVLFARS